MGEFGQGEGLTHTRLGEAREGLTHTWFGEAREGLTYRFFNIYCRTRVSSGGYLGEGEELAAAERQWHKGDKLWELGEGEELAAAERWRGVGTGVSNGGCERAQGWYSGEEELAAVERQWHRDDKR